MTQPTDPYATRRPRIGKATYLVALTVTILLGIATFFSTSSPGELLIDVADVLLDVDEILFPKDAPIIVSGGEAQGGANEGIEQPWYQIYFTQPSCPLMAERHGGIDETMAGDLAKAQMQVDIAAFDLDAEPIINALIDLAQRNIGVRVVTDADHGDQEGIRRLRRHGISVVEDKRRAFMHNKFIVIDQTILWTGSLNLTSNGVYCNNNNMVRFVSAPLAENYTVEMDEMYIERSFGPESANATPHEEMNINGVTVENYFASEKKLVNAIARAVARAQDEILFLAFSFTNEDIGEAMLGRAEAGVALRGIFEEFGATGQSSYYPIMLESGVETLTVRTDKNPNIMHHKVIIIDRKTTIFGSFNFTRNANQQNDENIVIVHDPVFTAGFLQEFERRWAETESSDGWWNQLWTN